MLLESIGRIFDQNFSNSLGRFCVPDRGTERDGLRVVLLVESPHTVEVSPHMIDDRYPLAGSTEVSAGLRVRNKLAERKPDLPSEPIGSLVHDGHGAVLRLGIMNASQLPLQKSAYRRNSDHAVCNNQTWINYHRSMSYIRRIYDNGGKVRWKTYNKVEELRCMVDCLECAIIMDLRRRLIRLRERSPEVLLVRCGHIARNFFAEARIDVENTCDLPHPTRRQPAGWQTLNCSENQCFQSIIARLWGHRSGR